MNRQQGAIEQALHALSQDRQPLDQRKGVIWVFLVRCLRNSLSLLRRDDGQGLIEYALIIVLIAIVVVLAVTALGAQVNTMFGTIVAELEAAVP